MAPGRDNGLSKSQASLLHAVCACNYLHSPLKRRHKRSVFVSRFTPSRHFFIYLIFFRYKCKDSERGVWHKKRTKTSGGQVTAQTRLSYAHCDV
jgi:hypothetical protein